MVEIKKFYQASEPNRALRVENPEDHKYYIDFSSVRGGEIILEMKDNITLFSDDRSCALFTGHIGCGKSTELFRLKKDLEESGFHVVYFESSENLELTDVDIIDVMLAIAQQVTQSLAQLKVEEPKTFNRLLRGVAKVLQTEIELSAEGEIPGIGKIAANTEGKVSAEVNVPLVGKINASNQEGFSLVASGIGKITAKAKDDSKLRAKLSEYLGPQKTELLKAINQELLEPAIAKLKQQGKKGLVVIVDNLDRLDNRPKAFGTPQQEYLFVDQGEYLNKLGCHVVYTMPLALKFSNEYGNLTQRFDDDPKVLPMVQVKLPDGTDCQEGINLLRQTEFQSIEALLSAVQTAQDLKKALIKQNLPLEKYPTAAPALTLQIILDNIRERNQLTGHQNSVYRANFSPDGQRIVTASEDKTARIWDLSGKQITELQGHQDIIYNANFSPDGQRIVTASRDSTARIWRVDKNLDELLFRSCQWLNDYLVTHPEELLKLEICQDKPRLKAAATFLVEKGEKLAREGNIDEAVADFQTALKLQPDLQLNPQERARQLAKSSGLVKE